MDMLLAIIRGEKLMKASMKMADHMAMEHFIMPMGINMWENGEMALKMAMA